MCRSGKGSQHTLHSVPRKGPTSKSSAMAPREHGYAHARQDGAGACWPVVWPLARGSLASLCLLGAATVRSLCPSGALGRSDPALAPYLPDVWCIVVLVWLLWRADPGCRLCGRWGCTVALPSLCRMGADPPAGCGEG